MTAPSKTTFQPQDALVDLVRQVQRDPSDRPGKEALANAIAPGILAAARRFCRLEHDADETAQEALVAVLLHIQDLQDPHAFRSWMYRIVYRASLRSNSGPGADAMPLTLDLPDTKQRDHTEVVEQQEQVDLLKECVSELDREAAGILHLLFVENLSLQEVAVVIGRPRTTVADLRERAFELLRGKMRKRGVQAGSAALGAMLIVAMPQPIPDAAVQRVVLSAFDRIDGISTGSGPAAVGADGHNPLFTRMSLSKAFLFSCLVSLVGASIFLILRYPARSSESSTESTLRVILNSIESYHLVNGNYPIDRELIANSGEDIDSADLEVRINANVVKNLLSTGSQGAMAGLGEGRYRLLPDGSRVVIDEFGNTIVIKPLIEKHGTRWQVTGIVAYSKGQDGLHDWLKLRYLAQAGAESGCWPPPKSVRNQWREDDPNMDNMYVVTESAP